MKICAEVFAAMGAVPAGAVLSTMDSINASTTLSKIPIPHAAAVVGQMTPKEAVEVQVTRYSP